MFLEDNKSTGSLDYIYFIKLLQKKRIEWLQKKAYMRAFDRKEACLNDYYCTGSKYKNKAS